MSHLAALMQNCEAPLKKKLKYSAAPNERNKTKPVSFRLYASSDTKTRTTNHTRVFIYINLKYKLSKYIYILFFFAMLHNYSQSSTATFNLIALIQSLL